MECTVYERGDPIGRMTAEREGLFWRFHCNVPQKGELVRRIYVLSLWRAEYLGIPAADGSLTGRIAAKHLPSGVTGAVASGIGRGQWLPWRGEVEGVAVEDGCLLREDGGMLLALPPEQAARFPIWLGQMEARTVLDREMLLLPMDVEGRVIWKEKEGATDEETMQAHDRDVIADDPAFEPAADHGLGFGEQADCPDL